jgi:hypothetical protein
MKAKKYYVEIPMEVTHADNSGDYEVIMGGNVTYSPEEYCFASELNIEELEAIDVLKNGKSIGQFDKDYWTNLVDFDSLLIQVEITL